MNRIIGRNNTVYLVLLRVLDALINKALDTPAVYMYCIVKFLFILYSYNTACSKHSKMVAYQKPSSMPIACYTDANSVG